MFSSTTATYGTPEKMPIAETTPQQPINPYGFSKLVVERMLDDYAAAYGFGFAALRYFNAAGAAPDGDLGEDHTPESHLIPIVLQVALGQRESISIFGDDYPTPDGTCIRDYVHVDDLATAHLAALERLQPGRAIKVNLGTGRGYSVREVIDACRKVTGHAIPAVIAPRRPGDPPELVADARLARQLLGWTPQVHHDRVDRRNRLALAPVASAGVIARRHIRLPLNLQSAGCRDGTRSVPATSMQNIIVEKPYQFIPPYRGTFWSAVLRGLESISTTSGGRKAWSITRFGTSSDCGRRWPRGMAFWSRPTIRARPIRWRWAGWRSRRHAISMSMASWHLFQRSRLNAWAIRAMGGFSVNREGVDRQAINMAIELLAEAQAAADHLSRRGHQPHGRPPASAARRRGLHRPGGGQEAGQAIAAGQGRRASGRGEVLFRRRHSPVLRRRAHRDRASPHLAAAAGLAAARANPQGRLGPAQPQGNRVLRPAADGHDSPSGWRG